MIKDIREQHKNVLLLDCGDLFFNKKDIPELRAEIGIEGLNLMKYDALNLGDGELSFGLDFLKRMTTKSSVSLLSANIIDKNHGQGIAREYLIKEFNGFRVGIIGLALPDYFEPESLIKDGLVINDPEKTLKRILSEIKEKEVDIIILLSHIGFEATKELVQKNDGIDVAIAGHGTRSTSSPEPVGNTLVVQNSFKGRYLGILNLTLTPDGSIDKYQGKKVQLSEDIPDDPELAILIKRFKKEAALDEKGKRDKK